MIETIHLKINHKPVRLKVDGDRTLLWDLRTDLGLTGTKCGCGESTCDAGMVLFNDKAVRSCQTFIKNVKGKKVITHRWPEADIIKGVNDNFCRCSSYVRIVEATQNKTPAMATERVQ